MEYYGKNGKYSLASQPMKQGGEGAIYAINGRSDLVAKIYFKERVTAELAEKLAFMSNNPPDASILSQIAWPQDVLREQNGDFVGFVMPKLKIDSDLKEIYVYPPKKNLQITYDQKIIIAINICVVISAIHKAGYTFGDFNPLNIGVNLSTGHVAFLDTDSYHIYDKYNRKMYRCGVCLDGYVAPELIQQCKGTDYLSAPLPTFTQETDKFALAIHIFKLLMNGFTPFNGIKETDSVSQASPGRGNQAIEKDNYCFKAGNKPQSVATPDLSAFPPDIQYLFKRAFIDGRENPEYRPSADEWYKALLDYKKNLVQCKRDVNHFYYVNDRECPYCAAEDRYNASLGRPSSSSQMTFSQPISVPGTSTSNSGNYRPTSASSPRVSGSSNSSYVGASGYQTSSTHKKKGNFTKKLIGWVITLGIVGALFGFVVWPKMIYPNMANEDLYTPEIVQTYSGSYSTGTVEGEAVVTILSCDNSGNVAGYFEFIVDNTYGKYEVSGKISEKKNNGNLVLVLKSGQWLVQPDNYTPLETMTVEISNQYQKFECDQYGINWSMGLDDSNSIKTADDLRKLSNSNGVFQLKNDIDLAGKDWTPITGFSGTLLGNGYSIKNLTIHTSSSNVGLFDSVSGSISNLKLENVDIEVQGGYENVGSICGSTSGSINACEVTGSIKATKCTNVGGIVGQVSSKNGGISDCKNAATVEGLDNVGGVSGHIYTMFSFAFISNENTGYVVGNNYVGGLLGCVAPKSVGWTEMSGDNYGDLVIKKCVNNGEVAGNDYVGGMAGSFSGTSTHLGFGDYYTITSSMSDNTNNATIAGRDYVGGLAGYTGGSANSISNCYNNADITGNYYVGGYVGYSSRAEITDAENNNKVSGKAYVGGIAGVGYSLKNCTNNGIVESTGTFLSDTTLLSCTGGIAGQANFVHSCINNKDIIVETNGYYVGGVVGIIKSDAIINMDGNKNYGNVAGYAYVGGFAGAISSQPGPGDINYYEGTLIISNVLNSGNISALTEYAGGITGHVEGAYRHYGFGDCKNVTYQISFCNNTGDITGTANVDGIAGKIGEYVVTDETVLNTNESTGQITIK